MNDKLKAWQGRIGLMNQQKLSGARSRNPGNTLVTLLVHNTKKISKVGDKYEYDILSVSLHPRILGQASFKRGDQIELEIKGNEGCLTLNTETGKQLCAQTKTGPRSYVRYRMPLGFFQDFPTGTATQVEATAGMIVFQLPEVTGA